MQKMLPDFEIPDELPVLPLREFVIFPYMVAPLVVAREKSIAALEDALAADRLILLVAQRNPEAEEPRADELQSVGTVAMVMRVMRMPDGRVKALVQGLARARLDSFVENMPPASWVRAKALPEAALENELENEALVRAVRSRVSELLPLKNLPSEVLSATANVKEPGRVADLVAAHLGLNLADAQRVLETVEPLQRLRCVDELIRKELELASMQVAIQSQAKEEMTRSQREQFLREQLRAIQAELGEGDSRIEEIDDYREKIEDAGMPPHAREESFAQLGRLERMHPDGPEAQVVRTYLDWLTDLPWSNASVDNLDLTNARNVLDADHAHLTHVKDRILEFLGVRKLREDSRGPILCFVGPPGVGKTSLGRSIARALGREFIRISLGGVRDEAEIRGHRRTYVGAMPGRILQGLKQAGTNNPVCVLDELDKLASDYRGDPAAALLEVLDPEQNSKFSDHYLNVPFDLSKVLFIATANLTDPIPGPLRDRMEIIRLSGYTPEEKIEIARSYLIPRQTEESGLPPDRLRWSPAAIRQLATDYTHEAGVRNLERKIAAVCRKVARRAAEGDHSSVSVNQKTLPGLLGPVPFRHEKATKVSEVGVVNGLAWTEAGGEILRLEATLTRGRGFVLTGQLGDVMKESGAAALTFARWRAAQLGIEESVFARHQLHVHLPAGAIPKDGPSAGITIATAILSLATEIAVRSDVAMTGEVTLRGRVLPVGGVREKALAALRAGMKTVILPKENMQDLSDIPRELKRKIRFVPVTHMDEVIEAALERKPGRRVLKKVRSRASVRIATPSAG